METTFVLGLLCGLAVGSVGCWVIQRRQREALAELLSATSDLDHAIIDAQKERFMANPVVDDVRDTVARATDVVTSAAALIRGFNDRMQAAVDAALANGATAEELAPVQAEIDAFDAAATDLAEAVAENTGETPEEPDTPEEPEP